MNYEDNPKSIKFYVKRYIIANKEKLKGKKVIDFPAGNGISSRIIKENGGIPLAFDLFPEYFKESHIECKCSDIKEGIPLENGYADYLICQEGIEHFADQLSALKEFNRVLTINGTLLITTPNYSNLRSKLSYLLSESERFNSTMPPNEFDSVWMADQSISKEIYLGHIFLLGIQKLRVIASLSGFRIIKIHPTRIKTTSLILMFFFYPFILLSNTFTFLKNRRKAIQNPYKMKTYKELFRISINPRILTDSHLMIEFEKYAGVDEVYAKLQSENTTFGTT